MLGSLRLARVGQTASSRFLLPDILPGVFAVLAAAPLAFMIYAINGAFPGQQEKAATITALMFVLVASVPVIAYIIVKRKIDQPANISWIVLSTAAVLLMSTYFYTVSFSLFFPADFLIWSETEFISDILKFRLNYPLYTADVNNESFIYPPGTQILTYSIASALGNGTSLAFFRIVHLGYVFLAAIFSYLAFRDIFRLRYGDSALRGMMPWSILWVPALFLIATNSMTNPFVTNLHNDGLALAISAFAYYMLVRYTKTRDWRYLVIMALIPATGFLIKQLIAVWAPLFVMYLLLFDRPRSISRITIYTVATVAGMGASLLLGNLLFGEHYNYWLFTAAGNHSISILRAFQHILDAWPYFAVGLLGGFVILRGQQSTPLSGLWIVWLGLILIEAYTSGIAWMIHHLGPGSLVGGIWFAAAITRLWSADLPNLLSDTRIQRWAGYGITVAIIVLVFNGLGMLRLPLQPISDDSTRYVQAIENEFKGLPADKVLLDSGSWIYLENNVVQKDRVTSIGDRGYGGTGDFSGIVQRLADRHYSKILFRNVHEEFFWYDSYLWSDSSNIRETLLANYEEVRVIKAVEDDDRYLFGDISVFVPKS